MNLHLLTDEKYADDLAKVINKIDNKNNHIVCYKKSHNKLNTFTHIKSNQIEYIPYNSECFKQKFLTLKKSYNKIIIYPLTNEMADFIINHKHENVKFFWAPVGMDIYGSYTFLDTFLFDKLTIKHFYRSGNPTKNIFPISALRIIKRIKHFHNFIKRKQALKRVNYILDFNKFDHELLLSKNTNLKTKLYPFIYPHFDSTIKNSTENKINNKLILLGNSADFTNNHIDALYHLKKIDIKAKMEILCPLVYGGSAKYKNAVISTGEKLFPGRFMALTSFLQKEKYFQLISKVNAVVMYHNRTQAIGNLSNLIYAGKKVFLKKKNTLYSFYASNNFIVYKTDELCEETIFNPLDAKAKEINMKLAERFFSNKTAIHYMKNIITNGNGF